MEYEQQATLSGAGGSGGQVEDGYEQFAWNMRARFGAALAAHDHLFITDAEGLFDAFLGALPPAAQQHYRCQSCRRFVDTFGGLVVISADGAQESALWHEADWAFGGDAIATLRRLAERAAVVAPFHSPDLAWGTASNHDKKRDREWRHMHVRVPPEARFGERVKTAFQRMAEQREDFGSLARGLAEFTPEVIAQAVKLLGAEALYRSEKVLGAAEWLAGLHERMGAQKNKKQRENILWRAVAWAPAGYCHPRSTMIGTLLEDLASGASFETVKRRFDDKMRPDQYQRPRAPPSAGNIAEAERIVEKLGIAASLRRRSARLEDLQATLWRPRARDEAPAERGGVFSHLSANGRPAPQDIVPAPLVMTWAKFQRDVLAAADAMELVVPHGFAPFTAFTAASDPGAPPILQWDAEERRNALSIYTYMGGSPAERWSIVAGAPVAVTAVAPMPWHQHGEERFVHMDKAVVFVLEGAVDKSPHVGLALFPEVLRSELHGIRATVEAHSQSRDLGERDAATASGLALGKAGLAGVLRVHSKGQRLDYRIDRWD